MSNLVNLQVQGHYKQVDSKPNKAPYWILWKKKTEL